jgi:RNA-splicing ligase RtcB
MKTNDLIRLGVSGGEATRLADEFIRAFIAQGNDPARLEVEIVSIVANPTAFFEDELRAPLARALDRPVFTPRKEPAPWRQWGEGLEREAVKQMSNACALPIAVAGALMPDAHVGYGLPIGGVLATDNSVIPYAVGVDIACRMKLTVYDRKANTIAGQRDRLANVIESDIENPHNFAWKEIHEIGGALREVVVHRKGATPAGVGVLGIIPGSMAAPGYVVSGKASPASLHSASHGAGRLMSRTKAMQSFTWSATWQLLAERGVELLSAGLDEVPGVYKDIHAIMAAQTDLVEVLGRFDPKLMKMCPAGERAED